MITAFCIEQTIRKRKSIRNYSTKEIEGQLQERVTLFISGLSNPFGRKVHFHVLDLRESGEKIPCGTYGVIKGARHFFGCSIRNEPQALEALGYELEHLVLYLTYLGLGTCWLGGTFNRASFAQAMKVDEEALFPMITPYGYEAPKRHRLEAVMRSVIRADQRKTWEFLFFKDSFDRPLRREEAGDLGHLLEMVRLGPSASNKQPWRILIRDGLCHFYEAKEPKYSAHFPYDIQRVDLGIAACHFDLAAKEKGIQGKFDLELDPQIHKPDNLEYVFSWTRMSSPR